MWTICILQINAERLLKNADQPRPFLLLRYPSSGPLGLDADEWIDIDGSALRIGFFRGAAGYTTLNNLA
jgi:hypothetical protein